MRRLEKRREGALVQLASGIENTARERMLPAADVGYRNAQRPASASQPTQEKIND
jgi:hypothetical protein